MIQSRADYRAYLAADRVALGLAGALRDRAFNEVWRFERLLRRAEYVQNCRRFAFRRWWARYRMARKARQLGYTIPLNTFGPGLSISHRGTIVVNAAARVGANCRLHVCVNIGSAAGQSRVAPVIGDNCYIGPGAKLFGPVVLGDNVVVGANAVVNRSFPAGNVTIGGIPAQVVSEKTSEGLLMTVGPMDPPEVQCGLP